MLFLSEGELSQMPHLTLPRLHLGRTSAGGDSIESEDCKNGCNPRHGVSFDIFMSLPLNQHSIPGNKRTNSGWCLDGNKIRLNDPLVALWVVEEQNINSTTHSEASVEQGIIGAEDKMSGIMGGKSSKELGLDFIDWDKRKRS